MMEQTQEYRSKQSRFGVGAGLLGVFCIVASATVLAGCFDTGTAGPQDDQEGYWDLPDCDLDPSYLVSGGTGFDGIPSLLNPEMVGSSELGQIGYLEEDHRVIGVVVDGKALAYPLSALWYHEIVNLNQGGNQLVVTHSSLSGSSRVFHRSAVAGAPFGVSGFLYKNNLLFFDRVEAPSLWAQMTSDARCGPLLGSNLSPYPFVEATWAGWKALHPNTLVMGIASAGPALWGSSPYGNYEDIPEFLFDDAMPPADTRLPPKERVLGIPIGSQGGVAFSFTSFAEAGSLAVAHGAVGGRGLVVFWRGDLEGASAFWAEADGETLTFSVQDGSVVDQETGTNWSFTGVGSGGPLDGVQLEPVAEATVAYWGAWAAFYPGTDVGGIG